MYSITDVQDLLSKNGEVLLTANGNLLFTKFEPRAAEIVLTITSIDPAAPPEWVKLPFVYILEYLILHKFSGQSPEYIQMVKDHYTEAKKILQNNSTKTTDLASKVIDFEDMYGDIERS